MGWDIRTSGDARLWRGDPAASTDSARPPSEKARRIAASGLAVAGRTGGQVGHRTSMKDALVRCVLRAPKAPRHAAAGEERSAVRDGVHCLARAGACVTLRRLVVVVTGASSGIGRAAARAFAARGDVVLLVARRREQLEAVLRECRRPSPDSSSLVGDVGTRPVAETLVAEAVARYGRCDVLVNNAGVPKHQHVTRVSADEAERVLRINFLSCVWATLPAIAQMGRQAAGGAIVNVSSFAAHVVPPREAVYAASKAAMTAFTEGLWSDLADTTVHAGLVTPGPIDTEIWDKSDEPPGYRGRRYPPELVADAILEVADRRQREITVPRRNLALIGARLLRAIAPSVLLRAMARMERKER